MPLVTLKMTEEEAVLLERLTEVTFSRSRSEVIRDALMELASCRNDLTIEWHDANRARKFYLPRTRRKAR